MHMIDVMKKLQGIAEDGYDNENQNKIERVLKVTELKQLRENDQQEVTFYNSGYGQKPSDGKKQQVHGSLKMGERGPIFVTQDGIQATWDATLGWLADMD